jgi:membrane-associated phospholipid phosphatase
MSEEAGIRGSKAAGGEPDGSVPKEAGATDREAGRRLNERLLMLGVGAYALLVVFLMIDQGVSITPDVLAVAFALVAFFLGRGLLFLRDWIPFVIIFLAYELMRGVADNAGFPVHIADVIAVERTIALGHLPTEVLQNIFDPSRGVNGFTILATIVYMLHFVLPIVTGFVLWLWRRRLYYSYVAAFILLSMAGFVTFLLLPVAPPWWAAETGHLAGPDGRPVISYLKPDAFAALANALGFNGRELYTYAFYQVNPNGVAAFPSLHAGYPFLSFLVLRHAFGRWGWLAFGYFLLASFSIILTGDHYLVDVLGGVVFAWAAYLVVAHPPRWFRRAVGWLSRGAESGPLAEVDA